MTNAVLIIAHAPLADALRRGALHVFPDAAAEVAALDVPPDAPPEATLTRARAALARWPDAPVLVLADVVGATPCNVARRLVEEGERGRARLVAGANLPMLLRALNYRRESLDEQAARAIEGGVQGVQGVAAANHDDGGGPGQERDAR